MKQADLDEGLRSDGLTAKAHRALRGLKRENKRLRMGRDILIEEVPVDPSPVRPASAASGIRSRSPPPRHADMRTRSTSARGTVQVCTRPTDRRTRSDSVKPAERALARYTARFRVAGAAPFLTTVPPEIRPSRMVCDPVETENRT